MSQLHGTGGRHPPVSTFQWHRREVTIHKVPNLCIESGELVHRRRLGSGKTVCQPNIVNPARGTVTVLGELQLSASRAANASACCFQHGGFPPSPF
jgi:hypothetical protein